MKVIYNRLLPFRGFTAINLFGIVFARRECRPLSEVTLRHEAIHTRQMRETGYVGFYLIYIAEWLYQLWRLRDAQLAYYAIRFEREAYAYQDEAAYPVYRKPYTWRHINPHSYNRLRCHRND